MKYFISCIILTLCLAAIIYVPYLLKTKSSNTINAVQETQIAKEPEVNDNTILNEKPAAQDIINRIKNRNQNKAHPRLMATSQDFERIKSQISSDKQLNERYLYIKTKADAVLNENPVVYELPDGARLLSISRKAFDRIMLLSFVYRISGDKKYADRAWLELQTISGKNPDQEKYAFADWHPAHFLDTAEMTNAAAIGYDWLYDYLTEGQKAVIREAILEYGLKQAIPFFRKKGNWVKNENNWNGVCNGGLGMGALAIADEGGDFEAISGEVLEGAINSLPIMLKQYSPDGGWFEGPGYWDYGTTFAAYFMSALDSSLGTDYGLSKIPGISTTGDFPVFLNGPKGSFNFADAGSAGIFKSPVLLYLAGKFNKPEYMWYFNKVYTVKDSSVMGFIWLNSNIKEAEPKSQDKYFRNVEVAALHSSFMNPQEMYVGFKAGTNGLSHGDLDIGSFVFDANGVRWFFDIGSENYNLPNYFKMGKFGPRWEYYRKRAEAHNTLVINPSSLPDQNALAKTKITAFKECAKDSYAITDMTDAYKSNASSVKRGIKMDKENQTITVQDEIAVLNPSEIWWFANTQAAIELSSDKKTAVLSRENKKLKVQISSPSNAAFEVMKAEPLSSSPNPKGQTANTTKKLAVHSNNAENTTICVVMSPMGADDKGNKELPVPVPLKDWK